MIFFYDVRQLRGLSFGHQSISDGKFGRTDRGSNFSNRIYANLVTEILSINRGEAMNETVKHYDYWGIDNDYGVLRDVLLGKPDYFRWVEAGPLIGRTLKNMHKTGIEFDFELSQRQHREMVSIYEKAGVTCHYLDADPVLHRNFFARDSCAMTPWGALICHMQLKCRRADYVSVIKFCQENNIPIWNYATAGHFEGGDFVILEPGTVLIGYCGERSEQEGSEQVAEFVRKEGWVIDWLKAKGFDFVDVGFAEAKDLGVNLVSLGNKRVLSMAGSVKLNQDLRDRGYEVYAPDMSMFTLGGGGVHCLCQALKRDPVSL